MNFWQPISLARRVPIDEAMRVAEQLKTAAIKNYQIELDEPAERVDGTLFTDFDVRAALVKRFPKFHDRLMGFTVRMVLPLVQVPVEGEAWGFPSDAAFAPAVWLYEARYATRNPIAEALAPPGATP